MKSKEGILARTPLKEMTFEYDGSGGSVGYYSESACIAAMTEYASQQTAAIDAERDEYRKALEQILALPDEQADGDGEIMEDPGQAIYDMQAIASKTLAKHPQQ